MYFQVWKIPIAIVIATVIVTGIASRKNGPVAATSATIQIDYASHPEFEGVPVEIDGEPVGRLEPTGGEHRAIFHVQPGPHIVKLRRAGYESKMMKVEVGRNNAAILRLEIHETYSGATIALPAMPFGY